MRYALILFLATGLSWTLRAAEAASDRLHKVLEQYMEERLKLFPFEATSIGDPRYNDQFPNGLSEAYRSQQRTFYQKHLALLGQFHRDSLPQSDQLSYDVLKREMTLGLQEMSLLQGNGGYPVMRHMTINQFASFPIDFVLYGSGQNKQPFKTVKDYENWLKRMEGFPRWADSAIGDMIVVSVYATLNEQWIPFACAMFRNLL